VLAPGALQPAVVLVAALNQAALPGCRAGALAGRRLMVDGLEAVGERRSIWTQTEAERGRGQPALLRSRPGLGRRRWRGGGSAGGRFCDTSGATVVAARRCCGGGGGAVDVWCGRVKDPRRGGWKEAILFGGKTRYGFDVNDR